MLSHYLINAFFHTPKKYITNTFKPFLFPFSFRFLSELRLIYTNFKGKNGVNCIVFAEFDQIKYRKNYQ